MMDVYWYVVSQCYVQYRPQATESVTTLPYVIPNCTVFRGYSVANDAKAQAVQQAACRMLEATTSLRSVKSTMYLLAFVRYVAQTLASIPYHCQVYKTLGNS